MDGFRASGRPVRNQHDLPPQLRDKSAYQDELSAKKPAGKLSERSKEDVLSVLRVFRYIRDQESDSDHIQGLNSSIDRVCEIYGRDISLPKDDPDVDDVRKTLKILEEEGVDYSLNPYHPNTTLANEHYTVFVYAFEIPEYLGGLPEPSGNWDIVFKDRSVPNS